jgi:hypothetical protein
MDYPELSSAQVTSRIRECEDYPMSFTKFNPGYTAMLDGYS